MQVLDDFLENGNPMRPVINQFADVTLLYCKRTHVREERRDDFCTLSHSLNGADAGKQWCLSFRSFSADHIYQ